MLNFLASFQKNDSSQLLKFVKKPQNVIECPCHCQRENQSEKISVKNLLFSCSNYLFLKFELNEGQAENLKDEFQTKTNKITTVKYKVVN